MNISHFPFILSDNLVGDKVRKTNGEDTITQRNQRDLKSCQIKMDNFLRGSSQYQILQEKSHPMSTELVSNAADGVLS